VSGFARRLRARRDCARVLVAGMPPFQSYLRTSDVSLPVKTFSGYLAFENRLVSTL